MDEPEIITATDASRSFSELLHRGLLWAASPSSLKKGNRLMARIVPVDAVEVIEAGCRFAGCRPPSRKRTPLPAIRITPPSKKMNIARPYWSNYAPHNA